MENQLNMYVANRGVAIIGSAKILVTDMAFLFTNIGIGTE